ncbi:MAG: hypothetical protein KAG66_24070, partial [Methylococcales bacterium]|nr:hypothetical protein [Methylococcales bacterium]
AGVELLWYFDLETKKMQQVPLESDWGLHNRDFQIAGKYVIALLADGALNRLAIYEKSASGWQQKKLEIPAAMQKHLVVEAVTEDGKQLVVSHSTASQLPQYYRSRLAEKGDEIQLVDFQKLCTLNK